jgi:hypothetical protein
MRHLSAWLAAALLALPSLALGSGGAPAGKAAPPIVPYLCSDGATASVIYRGGSDFRLARALVTHQGRTLEMQAAPTLYGVRYRSGTSAGPALAWSLRGEQAVLSEAPEADSYTRAEHELLRCIRVRGAPAAEAHATDAH